VAVATAKLDGLFFVIGVLFGIFVFGESVQNFDIFFNSSYMGRFTLQELFGVPTGWVVLGVVLMALFMFWGSEQLEKIFGGMNPAEAPKTRYYAAGGLVVLAAAVLLIGQPSNTDRWQRISPEMQAKLDNREVQIHPGELLTTLHDTKLNTVLLDVRDETDYNLFHLADAELVDMANLPDLVSNLHLEPANTVFVVMSNDESAATELWKFLVAESVPNVYILEGGVNNWIATFAQEETRIHATPTPQGDDELAYEFVAALGGAYPSAEPHLEDFELEYVPKIQLELKRAPEGGGCG
jgi:rhodanese-related sulfurtransferase